jgi:hypothetical protein
VSVLRSAAVALACVLAAACAVGCATGKPYDDALPDGSSYPQFQASVYPVLLRDCAFPECHGGEHRFLQVYGPGRARLDPQTMSADAATDAEMILSYQRSLSMLVTDADLERSLLLTKPLEPSAGGQGHKGKDQLGRNVYRSKADPAYAAIAAWARAAIGSGAQP